MTVGVLIWLSAPIALFIGAIGAISVFKAIYIDKRDVGGGSKVPLDFISLTVDLMMIATVLWMPAKALLL